jgi:divalent metal cation (Fe/Co/Zn/Cd) transporter
MAIERADLEAKLREIEEIVEETKSQAQTTGTAIAIVAVVAVVLIFLFGKRRGRKKSGARVEIYRV